MTIHEIDGASVVACAVNVGRNCVEALCEVATTFTCQEFDMLYELLAAVRGPDDSWLKEFEAAHIRGEQPEDAHYQGERDTA